MQGDAELMKARVANSSCANDVGCQGARCQEEGRGLREDVGSRGDL